jgi:hypothetical protein
VEIVHRRALDASDINEAGTKEMEVEGATGEEAIEEHLLREFVKIGAREKMEVPVYEGNLDVEELLD